MNNFSFDFVPAWGGPSTAGIMKQTPEDFRVDEISSTDFSDEGEHLYILVEKTNLTTEQCCKDIARIINKSPKTVSYAGLKDKHGITTQWLSIHCPGEDISDSLPEQGEGWRILQRRRHQKKLKIGWLIGNRFSVTVRDATRSETLEKQLENIKSHGLPNYFGPQRFGHLGNNLYQASQWFDGNKKVKNPFMKGMLLSAVRGYLFNQQLSARVGDNSWNRALLGDVMQLAGTHSIFVCEAVTEDIQRRINEHDLSPCGQLAGNPGILSTCEAYQQMQAALAPYQQLVDGLIQKKTNADWRAFILKPNNFQWKWLAENEINLTFELPAGSYATAILQELFYYQA